MESMTPEQRAVEQFLNRPDLPYTMACGCMGPQDGNPLCHCRMQWTEMVDCVLYEIKRGATIRDWYAEKVVMPTPTPDPFEKSELSLKEKLMLKHNRK